MSYCLLLRTLRSKIYKSLNRPVYEVSYHEGIEIEKRVPRNVLGPKWVEVRDGLSNLHNEELQNLYSSSSMTQNPS
jgi:hypothetical protein